MAKYNIGDTINLEAIPDPGYELETWTINDKPNGVKTTTYKHTVNEQANISAIFRKMIKLVLTASAATTGAYTGEGLVATINNKKEYTVSVDRGTKVELNVKTNPIIEQGNIDISTGNTVYWEFAKWSDENTDNPRSITVNKNIENLNAFVRVPARAIIAPGNHNVRLYNYYMYNYNMVQRADKNLKPEDIKSLENEDKHVLFENQRSLTIDPETGLVKEINVTIKDQLRNLYYHDMIEWWSNFEKPETTPEMSAMNEAWISSPYEAYFATAFNHSDEWMSLVDPDAQDVKPEFMDFIGRVLDPTIYEEKAIIEIVKVEFFYRNYDKESHNMILEKITKQDIESKGYRDYYIMLVSEDIASYDVSRLKEYLTKPLNIVNRNAQEKKVIEEEERYKFFSDIINDQINYVWSKKDTPEDHEKIMRDYISYALHPNYTI